MKLFATIGRSWEFAKISYRMVWDHKNLMIFPILSTIAAGLVLASFILPLWGTGTLEQWAQVLDQESQSSGDPAYGSPVMWVTLFLFYFCNYFVIVFFNSALVACTMQVLSGEPPKVGYGLSVASKRLPQIIGWALVSAVIGVLLRAIENINERVGQIVAAILGTAWTAMTYFVVPVIVVEGAGPFKAFSRSLGTLKETWGTALVGNFSLGFLGFLVMLPVFLIAAGLVFLAFTSGSMVLLVLAIAGAVLMIVLAIAVTSTADAIFKVVLYHYATDNLLPDNIDATHFDEAFASRN